MTPSPFASAASPVASPATSPAAGSPPPAEALASVPLTAGLVEDLFQAGMIDRPARQQALALLYPDRWLSLLPRLCAGATTGFLLAAVAALVALNWQEMTAGFRFFALQLLLVPAVLLAVWLPQRHLAGRLLLLAGTALTGLLLALFGQIFQTGADAWQLFALWAGLTAGWALLSRFAAHLVFWLLVSQIALVLWWSQVRQPVAGSDPLELALLLVLVNGSVLAWREILVARFARACGPLSRLLAGPFADDDPVCRQSHWLAGNWLRRLLVLATVLPLLAPSLQWAFPLLTVQGEEPASRWLVQGSLAGAAGWSLLFWLYRFRLPDFPAVALLVSCALILLATLLLVRVNLFSSSLAGFQLSLLAQLLLFGSGFVLLRRIQHQMRRGRAENTLPTGGDE